VPTAGGTANLTPEQVEAFRQSMRDKFSKGRGQEGNNNGGNNNYNGGKTPKTPTAAPAPTTSKQPKTPKVR
jgi:hypothetical protein